MYEIAKVAVGDDARRKAKQLPEPSGFRILLALPEIKTKTEGGIIRPDELIAKEQQASVVGFVIKMGPDCYKDATRFPTGPWCKEGDWILFRSYAGSKIRIHGKEFRLINDDTVEAVVEDPSGYERSW